MSTKDEVTDIETLIALIKEGYEALKQRMLDLKGRNMLLAILKALDADVKKDLDLLTRSGARVDPAIIAWAARWEAAPEKANAVVCFYYDAPLGDGRVMRHAVMMALRSMLKRVGIVDIGFPIEGFVEIDTAADVAQSERANGLPFPDPDLDPCAQSPGTAPLSLMARTSLTAIIYVLMLNEIMAIIRKHRTGRSDRRSGIALCHLCNKRCEVTGKACGGCGCVHYCDERCQRADWRFHKLMCKSLCAYKAYIKNEGLDRLPCLPPPVRVGSGRFHLIQSARSLLVHTTDGA